MCNACGFLCCASDEFGGCGCDHCDNPECWDVCEFCGEPSTFGCDCDEVCYDDGQPDEQQEWHDYDD